MAGSELQAAGGTAMHTVIAALPRAAPTCEDSCGIEMKLLTYAKLPPNLPKMLAVKWLANILFSKV